MNKSVRQEVFYKKLGDCDYGIAHLYEHLMVRNFCQILNRSGYVSGLWGWITGETFAEVTFISVGFYDDKVYEIFINYLDAPLEINHQVVKAEIARMEAEDDTYITYDLDDVMQRLHEFDKEKYTELAGESDICEHFNESGKIPKSKVLISAKNKKEFQNFSIKIGVKSPSKIEKEIFLRLNLIIGSVVENIIYTLPVYQYFSDGPVCDKKDGNLIYNYSEFTIKKKNYDEKEIKATILQTIKSTNLLKYSNAIKQFIRSFYLDGSADFPIDFYRQTGVLASKYHIYKIFTPENIQKVWDKLTVEVKKVR